MVVTVNAKALKKKKREKKNNNKKLNFGQNIRFSKKKKNNNDNVTLQHSCPPGLYMSPSHLPDYSVLLVAVLTQLTTYC